MEECDVFKIMEICEEMFGFIGCWVDVYFVVFLKEGVVEVGLFGGCWLMVDDMGGFLVGVMVERMGIF